MQTENNIYTFKLVIINYDDIKVYENSINKNKNFLQLKYLIECATDLEHDSYNIYHNKQDFTNKNNETLESIFENNVNNLPIILILNPISSGLPSSHIPAISYNHFCRLHPSSLLTNYCFNCELSFCSFCSIRHLLHETSRMTKFLKDIEEIIDDMGKDVNKDEEGNKYSIDDVNDNNYENNKININDDLKSNEKDIKDKNIRDSIKEFINVSNIKFDFKDIDIKNEINNYLSNIDRNDNNKNIKINDKINIEKNNNNINNIQKDIKCGMERDNNNMKNIKINIDNINNNLYNNNSNIRENYDKFEYSLISDLLYIKKYIFNTLYDYLKITEKLFDKSIYNEIEIYRKVKNNINNDISIYKQKLKEKIEKKYEKQFIRHNILNESVFLRINKIFKEAEFCLNKRFCNYKKEFIDINQNICKNAIENGKNILNDIIILKDYIEKNNNKLYEPLIRFNMDPIGKLQEIKKYNNCRNIYKKINKYNKNKDDNNDKMICKNVFKSIECVKTIRDNFYFKRSETLCLYNIIRNKRIIYELAFINNLKDLILLDIHTDSRHTFNNIHSNKVYQIKYYYRQNSNIHLLLSISQAQEVKLWCINDIPIVNIAILKISQMFDLSDYLPFCMYFNDNNCVNNSESEQYYFLGGFTRGVYIWDKNRIQINEILYNRFDIFEIKVKQIENDAYILITGSVKVKAINFNTKDIKIFEDQYIIQEDDNLHACVDIIYIKDILSLIDCDYNGVIRIFNFKTNELIRRISTGKDPINTFCIYNENILIAGCVNKSLKIVNFNDNSNNIINFHLDGDITNIKVKRNNICKKEYNNAYKLNNECIYESENDSDNKNSIKNEKKNIRKNNKIINFIDNNCNNQEESDIKNVYHNSRYNIYENNIYDENNDEYIVTADLNGTIKIMNIVEEINQK